MRTTLEIARYVVRDVVRSRWLAGYAGFFLVATFALLRFSDSETKALLSLVNVVLLVVPLANVVFGTMYLYASREFVELLLAQPIRRGRLFAGLYLGLTLPIVLAVLAGMGAALVIAGASAGVAGAALRLAAIAAALSAIFTALAALVAYLVDDRVRGLVAALSVWLLLCVMYDAAVLMTTVRFADYPLERPLLAAMFANPVDMARLLLLSGFDAAALLGYTGALFEKTIGGATGVLVATAALGSWIAWPLLVAGRVFRKKDF